MDVTTDGIGGIDSTGGIDSRDRTDRIDGAALQGIQELYDRGFFLQALRRAETLGPLAQWRGADARVLAGRLARQLGGDRLGCALYFRAHREHPDHPEAAYFHARGLFERFGPFPALDLLARFGDPSTASPVVRSDLLSLRDFIAADRSMDRAFEIAPDNA